MFLSVHIIAVLVFLVIVNIFKRRKDVLRKIPGPKPLPVIGNIHQLDYKYSHVQFIDWKDKYGDIFHLKIFSVNVVVLNSVKSIREALVTKATAFNGRPKTFRLDYTFYDGADIFFQTYSPKLVQMRKVGHSLIKTYASGMGRLETAVEDEMHDMLHVMSELKGQPFDLLPAFVKVTTNVIASMLIGERFKAPSEVVNGVEDVVRDLPAVNHPINGAFLDVFPWLRYFGNDTFKVLEQATGTRDRVIETFLAYVKGTIDPNNPRGVLDALFLNQKASSKSEANPSLGDIGKLEERDIKAIVSDVVTAGTLTTSSVMYFGVIILLNHPEVQQKLYQEIDKVVPRDRLPNLEDRQQMPYANAFVHEALRYMSNISFSLTHYTIADTSVGGYEIPKGTQVLANTYSVAHDERYFTDPWEFRPERFLEDDGSFVLADHPARRNLLSFGVGPRICIGENLAKTRLFLMFTAIVQKFQMMPEDPNDIPSPDPRKLSSSVFLLPDRYKCRALERAV